MISPSASAQVGPLAPLSPPPRSPLPPALALMPRSRGGHLVGPLTPTLDPPYCRRCMTQMFPATSRLISSATELALQGAYNPGVTLRLGGQCVSRDSRNLDTPLTSPKLTDFTHRYPYVRHTQLDTYAIASLLEGIRGYSSDYTGYIFVAHYLRSPQSWAEVFGGRQVNYVDTLTAILNLPADTAWVANFVNASPRLFPSKSDPAGVITSQDLTPTTMEATLRGLMG